MIVVDSSAVADYLAGTAHARWERAAPRRCRPGLHAPHLVDVEVAAVFRRLHLAGTLAPLRARTLLTLVANLPLVRYPHTQLLDRIWQLRSHVTAEGAAYVALAEALEAPVVTTDLRLSRAHGVRVAFLAP